MKTKTIVASALAMAFAAALALPAVAADTHAAMPKANGGAMGGDFKAMDTNGDGRISRDEYMKYHESDWNSMDSSKSGYVTSEQYQKASEKQQQSRTDGAPQAPGQNK